MAILFRFGLALFIFSLIACSVNKKNIQKTATDTSTLFDLQGHRGCRGLMPENTIPAFIKALELGVTTLEMDATISADNIVFISHEPFFNHEISTKPNGQVVLETEEKKLNMYRMNYEDIKRYDVGLKPHPRFREQQKLAAYKPTLQQVIDSVKAWSALHHRALPQFNIETKCSPDGDDLYHPKPEIFVELLMSVIAKSGIEKQTIIQSFDFRSLQYVHKKFPSIPTAALIEDYDKLPFEKQLEKLGFSPNIFSPAWQLVTAELVTKCHELGIKIIPWTVNELPVAANLKAMKVDGLITDYPDRIR